MREVYVPLWICFFAIAFAVIGLVNRLDRIEAGIEACSVVQERAK